MRRRWTAVALVVLAAAGIGCGLPDDRAPRIIAADEAPLDLSEIPGSPAPTAPEGDDEVELYFVRDGLLTPTTRATDDDGLETAIALLLGGPVEDERSLSTSINSEIELLSAEVDGATAILDLGCIGDVPADSCGVLAVGAGEQVTIFAQFTCTAMEVPGIDGVRFLQEGAPQGVTTADAGTVQSPNAVTCDDFRSLL